MQSAIFDLRDFGIFSHETFKISRAITKCDVWVWLASCKNGYRVDFLDFKAPQGEVYRLTISYWKHVIPFDLTYCIRTGSSYLVWRPLANRSCLKHGILWCFNIYIEV